MDYDRKTVLDYLISFNEKKSDFIFLENEDEKYTINEFLNTTIDIANAFYKNDIREGDIVAILVKKDIETIIYFIACQIIGAVALMIDKHEDISSIEEEYNIKIKYALLEDRKITKKSSTVKLEFEQIKDSRKTTIGIFSSGTTGRRKIVKQSQFAFINNAIDSKGYGNYLEDDIALAFLPLNHVFAIAMLFTAICFKFKVFVAKSIDILYLLSIIQDYHITRFNAVPSIFIKMAELKKGFDISSLRCAYIGGAPSSQDEYLKIEDSLGLKLLSVYGMSECIGISSGSYNDLSIVLANSVGKKYPLNGIKIAKDGEILVKSPSMCNGYLNEEFILNDGFLPTGDIGKFDNDGYLYILGRKKEIIISNGNNISIFEVSKKIKSLDLFKDFAIVGIKDKEIGESLAIAYVLNEQKSEKEIINELSNGLCKNEMPKKIISVSTIPLLDNGKVDKEKIRKVL